MIDAHLSYQISEIKVEKDPFAKARLLHKLQHDKDFSIKRLSQLTGMKSAHICHYLRLLRLPDTIVDGYYAHTVSKTHLMILSRVKDEVHLIALYEKILSRNLTAPQTENLVREHLYGIKNEGEKLTDEDKKQIEQVFSKIDPRFKVEIIQTRIKARINLNVEGSVIQTTNVLKKLANGKFVRQKS